MTAAPPILIAGPTASGKSSLALNLAERDGGMVINADSMQVYRELRILTARPTPEDEKRAPHALYGHVPAAEAYSVGRWLEDVKAAIAEARERGLRPIIVGGTGLYFKALLEGLAAIPSIAPGVRAHWRATAAALDAEALHAMLAERDPAMAARLPIADRQRVTRALEVVSATGRSLSDWQREPGVPVLLPEATERLVILPDRQDLYARCDRRFDAMMAAGGEAEAADLLALGLNPALPIMGALGVRPLAAMIAARITREEALARAKAQTRQYAKRQLTWIKRHMCAWKMIFQQ